MSSSPFFMPSLSDGKKCPTTMVSKTCRFLSQLGVNPTTMGDIMRVVQCDLEPGMGFPNLQTTLYNINSFQDQAAPTKSSIMWPLQKSFWLNMMRKNVNFSVESSAYFAMHPIGGSRVIPTSI